MSKEIKFKQWKCTLEYAEYSNGRTAITLIGTGEKLGEPIAVATVNMPDNHMEEGEVAIKDYAENDGVLLALQKAGIVSEPKRFIPSVHVIIPVVKLLTTKKEYNNIKS
jgi:hypothetical protein